MKQIVFLMLTILFVFSNVEAQSTSMNGLTPQQISFGNPKTIEFSEEGILFRIHPTGQVSYAIEQKIKKQYVNKNNKRYVLRENPIVFHNVHPHRSAIIKIGHVSLRYNPLGKIRQIGSVKITTQGNRITKVGHLQIVYNQHGKVAYIGDVKRLTKKSPHH
ncbi:hypothetical protein MWU59_09985 [Flavobacteriaceae bacterium F08102]|nr:hypothetical protein [Flavobacteriaceae bacterium F08102]